MFLPLYAHFPCEFSWLSPHTVDHDFESRHGSCPASCSILSWWHPSYAITPMICDYKIRIFHSSCGSAPRSTYLAAWRSPCGLVPSQASTTPRHMQRQQQQQQQWQQQGRQPVVESPEQQTRTSRNPQHQPYAAVNPALVPYPAPIETAGSHTATVNQVHFFSAFAGDLVFLSYSSL